MPESTAWNCRNDWACFLWEGLKMARQSHISFQVVRHSPYIGVEMHAFEWENLASWTERRV